MRNLDIRAMSVSLENPPLRSMIFQLSGSSRHLAVLESFAVDATFLSRFYFSPTHIGVTRICTSLIQDFEKVVVRVGIEWRDSIS